MGEKICGLNSEVRIIDLIFLNNILNDSFVLFKIHAYNEHEVILIYKRIK